MLPWTEIVKKETWVYNLQCSDCKHQLPTDHVEFSNKKCEVIHSNKKKIYQKSHDEAWFQKNIWFFWILIKFSTTCIKIVVFILSIFFIFLALNSYLHFFAFMCVYFSLYCLISNQLKIHFFFKTLSPKNALDNGRFSFQTNSEI